MTASVIAITAQHQSMSSIDLLEFVNQAREEFGEKPVRHNDFLARCKDELENEPYETFVESAKGRAPAFDAIRMTKDQCKLVAMRESKAVRRRVLARLNELEAANAQPTIPAVKDPQLAAMVLMLTQLDNVKQEQDAQRLELAEIRAKITATPEEYYTVAGYASLRGLSIDTNRANLLGRKAVKISKDYGVEICKAHSAIHGKVNTYHLDVLCEVFKAV